MKIADGWIYLDINPEPWAVGTISTGRRNGKTFGRMARNESLHTFKEEVREMLDGKVEMMPPGMYDLHFYFSRRLDTYSSESGRKANAHVADATNMQKALEDALQGILMDNDRDVRRITSEIIAQGPDAKPFIVIRPKMFVPSSFVLFPPQIIAAMDAPEVGAKSDNTWGGPRT